MTSCEIHAIYCRHDDEEPDQGHLASESLTAHDTINSSPSFSEISAGAGNGEKWRGNERRSKYWVNQIVVMAAILVDGCYQEKGKKPETRAVQSQVYGTVKDSGIRTKRTRFFLTAGSVDQS